MKNEIIEAVGYILFFNYISPFAWIFFGVRLLISNAKAFDYKEESIWGVSAKMNGVIAGVGMIILGLGCLFIFIYYIFFYTRYKIAYQESEMDKYPESVTFKTNDSITLEAKFVTYSNNNAELVYEITEPFNSSRNDTLHISEGNYKVTLIYKKDEDRGDTLVYEKEFLPYRP